MQPGLRLGQLCFFEIEEVQREYMNKPGRKYGRKLEPEMTRIFDDAELRKEMRSRHDLRRSARSLVAFIADAVLSEDTAFQESPEKARRFIERLTSIRPDAEREYL